MMPSYSKAIRLLRGKTQYSQKGNSPYSPFFSVFFPSLFPRSKVASALANLNASTP